MDSKRIVIRTGEKVNLVVPEMSDADVFYRGVNTRTISHLVGTSDKIFTIEKEKAFVEDAMKKEDMRFFTIIESATNEVIGSCSVMDINYQHGNAEVGISIMFEDKHGKGYGTEAMRLLVDYAFTELCLHKVILWTYRHNERAAHVYEKIGFRVVGVLKEQRRVMGGWGDELIMELMKEDWEKKNK